MADPQFTNNYEYQDHIANAIVDGSIKTREKPIVHFRSLDYPITVGQRAKVKTYDHPDMSLNYAPWVNTSRVVKVYENGNFDSTYTSYVLVGNDDLVF